MTFHNCASASLVIITAVQSTLTGPDDSSHVSIIRTSDACISLYQFMDMCCKICNLLSEFFNAKCKGSMLMSSM
ncbi:hypothetical protein KP509_30G042700 [Ceratopteris richardii]|uniref:Secreted protein n=1 Tax=Ceratopteris richardii TaxID=49495 RepID=A0A8T2R3M3_CERRI|nr:hypothetical protein KP509_30G042700 [Ceratopteris richardii]